ncbi:MAG: hypothetical protein A2937_03590 [Candidatus Yonathbacteria bacterium RIFCSPLOWO2_01_FULL_47_33b]|uniref:Uncharacterized protein n=1 Tax=Candidatus Yonathbacteria bacterium RIFCSPLOWO2_01_FULL_47_33b TaxID=1802727 RepID=A0A1G2SED6_9BACT|nr:MAG: hypothetical protein A2937_03590 [Candidatus Yonathbacteria bacterium RIFCSPLOWO2_01_FULL_47_33b]
MQKLCFANEELRNKFFAHVSPLEGRLFVQTMAGLEPGVYKERYPRVGVSLRGACVALEFHVNQNQELDIEKVTVLHYGGLKGLRWSAWGLMEQFWCKLLRLIRIKGE